MTSLGPATVYTAIDKGPSPTPSAKKTMGNLRAAEELQLKVGAQVMLTVNMPQYGQCRSRKGALHVGVKFLFFTDMCSILMVLWHFKACATVHVASSLTLTTTIVVLVLVVLVVVVVVAVLLVRMVVVVVVLQSLDTCK